MESININGKEYILKSDCVDTKTSYEYVLIRTYSAGVFTGHLKSRNGKEVVLNRARRIWYWDGAFTLSQLAMEGTSKPDKCKFACEVSEIILTEAIEIIPVSETAQKSIENVAVWSR